MRDEGNLKIKFKKISKGELSQYLYQFTPATLEFLPNNYHVGYEIFVNGVRVGYIIKTQFSKKHDFDYKYLFVSSDFKEFLPANSLKEAKAEFLNYIKRKSKNMEF